MFVEAWRLERDYFYDRQMHGIDWKAMLAKYRPLVDRVHSRDELSDLIAQMVSELSALHIFVLGGDLRKGPDEVETASLGAVLERDEAGGGYRVEHVYRTDPDLPEQALLLCGVLKQWLTGSEVILGVGLLGIPYLTRSYEMSMASHARFAAVVVVNYLIVGRLMARAPALLVYAACIVSSVVLCTWTALFAAGYRFF